MDFWRIPKTDGKFGIQEGMNFFKKKSILQGSKSKLRVRACLFVGIGLTPVFWEKG